MIPCVGGGVVVQVAMEVITLSLALSSVRLTIWVPSGDLNWIDLRHTSTSEPIHRNLDIVWALTVHTCVRRICNIIDFFIKDIRVILPWRYILCKLSMVLVRIIHSGLLYRNHAGICLSVEAFLFNIC